MSTVLPPKVTPPSPSASFRAATISRPTVEQIVKDWAKGLVPEAAPDMREKGPLAWVREEKVEELLAALKKEGYR